MTKSTVFAVLLLLGYVRKIGFIPNNIMNALLLIVSVIGGYLVIMKYYDISTRNNMYFDEYNMSAGVKALRAICVLDLHWPTLYVKFCESVQM